MPPPPPLRTPQTESAAEHTHTHTPKVQCFNAAIEACALADDVDGAVSFMAEMGRAGITPDDYSFRPLLTACERNSKPALKKDLMEAMSKLRVEL